MAQLKGEMWLVDGAANRLALEQVELLRAIQETGSISAAAINSGISYKTAWDRLERLNNLSQYPLVERVSGGIKGGGTQLTPYGEKILKGFDQLKAHHHEFMRSMNSQLANLDDLANFVRTSNFQASARNQFLGIVKTTHSDSVNSEIVLEISSELELVAQISDQSRRDMELLIGQPVLALVKASSIALATGNQINLSARNRFTGRVSRMEIGSVNTEVGIDIGNNKTLSAIITNPSRLMLGLKIDSEVIAFFKACSIILMRV